jgi:hypothetical protein
VDEPGLPLPSGAPAPSRREGALARWATTAWCLLAGAMLSVAPHAGTVWSDGFFAGSPGLQAFLWTGVARWGISAFGIVLLALGAWDVSRFVVEELT